MIIICYLFKLYINSYGVKREIQIEVRIKVLYNALIKKKNTYIMQ